MGARPPASTPPEPTLPTQSGHRLRDRDILPLPLPRLGERGRGEGVQALQLSTASAGLVPQLLKDINVSPAITNPTSLVAVGSTLFFAATDSQHGTELWRSDGTVAGTQIVADINPGTGNSNPKYLTNVNGTVFFQATDGVHGVQLWESNGTAAGTQMVLDINSGTGNSMPRFLTNVNGTLFFVADDGRHGPETVGQQRHPPRHGLGGRRRPGHHALYPHEFVERQRYPLFHCFRRRPRR